MSIELLTSSRAKTARACKRLHLYEYEQGYRPAVEDDVLRFGALVHLGLEAWWKAMQQHLEQEEWLTLALQAVGGAEPFEAARARVMLTAYHLRWKDESFEVLGVEERFEVELRNPATGAASRTWRLAGKLDVRVKDLRDGQVKVVEHKTTSEDASPGSDYWKRLKMDGQVSTYFLGSAALGPAASSCIYDVLAKPAQRPSAVPVLDDEGCKVVLDSTGQRVRTKDGKKFRQTGDTELGYVLQTRPETAEEFEARLMAVVAEAPDRFLGRGEVVRLESELEDAAFDLWHLGIELREARAAGRHPRNPDSCIRFSRTCPFFGVCVGEASIEDTQLFTRLGSVHPELAAGTAEASSKEESAA